MGRCDLLIGGAVLYTLGVVLWSVGALFLRAIGFPMMDIQAILLDTDVVLEYFLLGPPTLHIEGVLIFSVIVIVVDCQLFHTCSLHSIVRFLPPSN